MSHSLSLAEQWADRLARWQSSGLSQSAFCKQNDLKHYTFHYWRKKLQVAGRKVPDRFHPVEIAPTTSMAPVVACEAISLRFNGVAVDVSHDTDLTLLTKCFDALGYRHDQTQ